MSDRPKLTDLQRRRLASASQEALAWRQRLHMAQITDAPPAKLLKLTEETLDADNRYLRLLRVRGLCVGDPVRIVADGPYRGTETRVVEIEPVGPRIVVRLPSGASCLPFAHEVELADEQSRDQRRRKE